MKKFVLLLLVLSLVSVSVSAVDVSLPADKEWYNTDIEVNSGDELSISASGGVKIAGSGDYLDPEGISFNNSGASPSDMICPSASRAYMLVGKVGNDNCFEIGSSADISVESDGNLYLAVNDQPGLFGDNSGSWDVEVNLGEKIIFQDGFEDNLDKWEDHVSDFKITSNKSHSGEHSVLNMAKERTWIATEVGAYDTSKAQCYFYDGNTGEPAETLCAVCNVTRASSTNCIMAGITTPNSENNYAARGPTVEGDYNWYETSDSREEGWHKAEFRKENGETFVYVDGEELMSTSDAADWNSVVLWMNNAEEPEQWGYWDDIKVTKPEAENEELSKNEENNIEPKFTDKEDEDFTERLESGSLQSDDFYIQKDDTFTIWDEEKAFAVNLTYTSLDTSQQVVTFESEEGTKEFTYSSNSRESVDGRGNLIVNDKSFRIYLSGFDGTSLAVDLNGDGDIAGDEFTGLPEEEDNSEEEVPEGDFTVPGNEDRTPTGIEVTPGDKLEFEARGTIYVMNAREVDVSPDGISFDYSDAGPDRYPCPDGMVGELIAYIGDECFPTGSESEIIVENEGELYIGPNDYLLGDNSGSWEVNVDVERHEPEDSAEKEDKQKESDKEVEETENEVSEEVREQRRKEYDQEQRVRTCQGCMKDDVCLDVGTRDNIDGSSVYCNTNGEFEGQKRVNSSCQNDFECSTNTCSSGKCVDLQKQLEETQQEVRESQNLLEKIVDWFESIF